MSWISPSNYSNRCLRNCKFAPFQNVKKFPKCPFDPSHSQCSTTVRFPPQCRLCPKTTKNAQSRKGQAQLRLLPWKTLPYSLHHQPGWADSSPVTQGHVQGPAPHWILLPGWDPAQHFALLVLSLLSRSSLVYLIMHSAPLIPWLVLWLSVSSSKAGPAPSRDQGCLWHPRNHCCGPWGSSGDLKGNSSLPRSKETITACTRRFNRCHNLSCKPKSVS